MDQRRVVATLARLGLLALAGCDQLAIPVAFNAVGVAAADVLAHGAAGVSPISAISGTTCSGH